MAFATDLRLGASTDLLVCYILIVKTRPDQNLTLTCCLVAKVEVSQSLMSEVMFSKSSSSSSSAMLCWRSCLNIVSWECLHTSLAGQTYSFFRTRRWFRASWTYSRFRSRVLGSSPSSFRLPIMRLILNGFLRQKFPIKRKILLQGLLSPLRGLRGDHHYWRDAGRDWQRTFQYYRTASRTSSALSCLIIPHETSRAPQGYYSSTIRSVRGERWQAPPKIWILTCGRFAPGPPLQSNTRKILPQSHLFFCMIFQG